MLPSFCHTTARHKSRMDVPDLALIPTRRRRHLRQCCGCVAVCCTDIAPTLYRPDRQVAPPLHPEGPRLILESRRVAITITEWPAPPLAALQSFVLAAVTILQIPRMFCLHRCNKPRKNVARW